jgi:hypothetical protein
MSEEGPFVYATVRCLIGCHQFVVIPALVIFFSLFFFTEGHFKFGLFTLVTCSRKVGSNKDLLH